MTMNQIFAATIFTAISTTSMNALAYPSVQDKATYVGTYSNKSQTYPVSVELELVAHDPVKKTYTQITKTTSNGTTTSTTTEITEDKIAKPATIQPIINNCSAHGGTPEVITTKIGAYNTCALTTDDSNHSSVHWIADVPFGYAKVVIFDKTGGGATVLVLDSFQEGDSL